MTKLSRATSSAVHEALFYALSTLSKSSVITRTTKISELHSKQEERKVLGAKLRALGFKVTTAQLNASNTVGELSEKIGGQTREDVISRVIRILVDNGVVPMGAGIDAQIAISPPLADVIARKINREFRLQGDYRIIPGDLTKSQLAGEVVNLTEAYVSEVSPFLVAGDIVMDAASDMAGKPVSIDDTWDSGGLKLDPIPFRQAVEHAFRETFQRIPTIDSAAFVKTKTIARLVAYIASLI